MAWLDHQGIGLHWREDGDPEGQPVVLLNSLGTDLRLWDDVVLRLPDGVRLIRMDTRGHGLSDAPNGAYSLDDLTEDAGALLDHLALSDVTIVGVSLGGMMAQALAVARPQQITRLVLSNTAVRMGTKEMWQSRIAAVESGGVASISDAVLDRWFAPGFRADASFGMWRNMLDRTPDHGYAACCAALAQADLSDTTPGIVQPTLVISGSEDGASPPEIVQRLAELIPGAEYHEMQGVGHLPMAEDPDRFVALLQNFLQKETFQ